jgi:uncharacterized protein DUF6318
MYSLSSLRAVKDQPTKGVRVTTRNRRAAALTLACLCTTWLSACSNTSPEAGRPNTAPPVSSTASGQTEIPTKSAAQLTAPERPAAADGLTLAAGEAFIGYYSELRNYATATGDTGPMMAESDAGCVHCKGFVSSVKKSNGANGLLVGEYRESVKEISTIAIGEGGHLGADMVITVGQFVRRDSRSGPPVNSKAKSYFREVALSPRNGNWVMFELRQQES